MSALSAKLRQASDGMLLFWCPGCDGAHGVHVGEGPGPRWGYNGDAERPTFTPSILVRWPAHPNASEEFKEWRKERICHSFVTLGRIQFLADCTHHLAGQTVDIPDFDSDYHVG